MYKNMVKFFRCERCGHQFVSADVTCRDEFKCGAIVEFVEADDPDVNDDNIIRSAGIKPVGCGGKITEVSQEEAMSYVEE